MTTVERFISEWLPFQDRSTVSEQSDKNGRLSADSKYTKEKSKVNLN